MHFHLPKPLHGWREFAGEVGIIVVGVLIALSAEAAVGRVQEEGQLSQAEERMTAQIRDDDLPQAFARAAIGNCNEQQLNGIEDAVANRDRQAVARLASAYDPPFRTWDDDAWQAANSTQALKAADGDTTVAWSGFYVGMPLMNHWTTDEQEALRQLRARLGGTGPLRTEQQDHLFQLIATLRGTNKQMTGGSLASLAAAADLRISVVPAQSRAILADARRRYGSCLTDPLRMLRGRRASAQFEVGHQAAVR